ncbi:GL19221 [Drosophila persimilis]|uniref:GL19221 n=1 Tax=Drosophila persimilis TaxID=7234 RepID=B4G822_DROPE|nr:GL19221 [Drosophila persimilis]
MRGTPRFVRNGGVLAIYTGNILIVLEAKRSDIQYPEPNKPSSSFDPAIDNFLKDFGYGNQGRGYADY